MCNCNEYPFCNQECEDRYTPDEQKDVIMNVLDIPDNTPQEYFAPELAIVPFMEYCKIYGFCPACGEDSIYCPDIVKGYDGIYNSNL